MLHARKDYNERVQDNANIIPDDEPVFLIRAKDSYSLKTLDAWIEQATSNGDDRLATAISKHRQKFVNWQKDHGCKNPDTPEGKLVDEPKQ